MSTSVPKILVIDDEVFLRTTIRQQLRLLGAFEIQEAGTGNAALEAVGVFRPDVIFCDIDMQPMSGLEFVERLRAFEDECVRQTAVIMLTGNAHRETVTGALRLGISGYLIKPVSAKQLGLRISNVLAQAPQSE